MIMSAGEVKQTSQMLEIQGAPPSATVVDEEFRKAFASSVSSSTAPNDPGVAGVPNGRTSSSVRPADLGSEQRSAVARVAARRLNPTGAAAVNGSSEDLSTTAQASVTSKTSELTHTRQSSSRPANTLDGLSEASNLTLRKDDAVATGDRASAASVEPKSLRSAVPVGGSQGTVSELQPAKNSVLPQQKAAHVAAKHDDKGNAKADTSAGTATSDVAASSSPQIAVVPGVLAQTVVVPLPAQVVPLNFNGKGSSKNDATERNHVRPDANDVATTRNGGLSSTGNNALPPLSSAATSAAAVGEAGVDPVTVESSKGNQIPLEPVNEATKSNRAIATSSYAGLDRTQNVGAKQEAKVGHLASLPVSLATSGVAVTHSERTNATTKSGVVAIATGKSATSPDVLTKAIKNVARELPVEVEKPSTDPKTGTVMSGMEGAKVDGPARPSVANEVETKRGTEDVKSSDEGLRSPNEQNVAPLAQPALNSIASGIASDTAESVSRSTSGLSSVNFASSVAASPLAGVAGVVTNSSLSANNTAALTVSPAVVAGTHRDASPGAVLSVEGIETRLTSGSIATASDVGETHRTLFATPTTLEVGVRDGGQGWLKIRAEVGSEGSVTASLAAGSMSGQEMLKTQLPALNAYLHNEQMAVTTMVAERSFAVAASGLGGLAAGADGTGGFHTSGGSHGYNSAGAMNGSLTQGGGTQDDGRYPTSDFGSSSLRSDDRGVGASGVEIVSPGTSGVAAVSSSQAEALAENGQWLNVRA